MTANTKIEWADHTFNPWEGCQKVGPGCDHCYAENRNARFGGGVAVNWGPGAPRRRTSASNWQLPLKWERESAAFFAKHGRRQRVFCASLADVFDNEVDPQWRADLFNLINGTPNLDWLLLTKRVGNAASMIDAARDALYKPPPENWPWPLPPRAPLPNVWLGATIVNQEEADRDIPKLLAVPAAKRFLSIEPLLGPVDLGVGFFGHCPEHDFPSGFCLDRTHAGVHHIDWVIAGGESGPNARPSHPDWYRSLHRQCLDAGVPFLFKQWGEWLPINQQTEEFTRRLYKSNCVAKLHQDQAALDDCYGRRCTVEYTVVHFDGSTHGITEPMAFEQGKDPMSTFKVGKKSAGRLLDGIEHNGFPS